MSGKYVIKIKNDWIETTADLFLEWFKCRGGNEKGISQFLKDEKLDKLFSIKSFMDVMSGKAKIPVSFVAPMVRACPFELTMKEALDIMHTSKLHFKFGYDVEMDRVEIIKYHSMFMLSQELKALKEKVRKDAWYDERYKNVVNYLGQDTEAQFLNYRKKYLIQNGFDISDWDDEKIRSHKVKAGKSKEQRSLDIKRRKMLKRGFDQVVDMSNEEVEAFVFPRMKVKVVLSADEDKERKRLWRKRNKMKSRGYDVKKMTAEEILSFELPKEPSGRVPVIKLMSQSEQAIHEKRGRMRRAGIDEASMTDEQVKKYIKPKTDLTLEQRYINKKRKSLARRGKKVADLSDEEILIDRRCRGERTNPQKWLVIKRKKMIADGVDGAEKMTEAEVKNYSKYKVERRGLGSVKLYKKIYRLDQMKIDYEYWTDEEILNFDGRVKNVLEKMALLSADRKAKGVPGRSSKSNINEDDFVKVDLVERLDIVDEGKANKFKVRDRRNYENQRRKRGGPRVLAILNGIVNSKMDR